MAVFDLSTFLFTDSDDSVTQESEIIIPSGSSVNTLDGDDLVRSEYTTTSSSQGSVAGSVFGINVQGSFEMNGGNDRVESYVTYSGTRLPQAGLVNALSVGSGNNTTTFSTGDGDDRIIASAISSTFSRNAIGIANLSDSTIDTGNENDLVFGSAQNVLGTLS